MRIRATDNLKSYGYRTFAVSAPELWNSLSLFMRSCDNLSSFKSKLKCYLFLQKLIISSDFTFYYF